MHNSYIAYLEEKLNQLLIRFPRLFDSSILKERDRIISYFDEDFIQKRSAIYLLRILVTQHLQKKKLLGSSSLNFKSRALECRILQGTLHHPFASKKMVGVVVQLPLSNRYELLDQDTLQRSVKSLLPELKFVKGSLFTFYDNKIGIKTVYAEFEKLDNSPFKDKEFLLLKKKLKNEIFNKIEKLVPLVFKVRNQEEVLRNILTLGQEIDSTDDLPQAMISFETQTAEEISFTVILVRPENALSNSLELLFQKSDEKVRWVLETKQIVKYLSDHQPAVAYLFRFILIPDETLLRNDGSLNFFTGRQRIAHFLKKHLGDYRDFNGGILIKQEETLVSLKSYFPAELSEPIENIFYSITPIEMQAILPPSVLGSIIEETQKILSNPFEDSHTYHLATHTHDAYTFILVCLPYGTLYHKIKEHLEAVDFPDQIIAFFHTDSKDIHVFGYLISNQKTPFCDSFMKALSQLLCSISSEVQKLKVLKLCLSASIQSLDPRIGADAVSSVVLKMMFEGLTRISRHGTVETALAEKIEISMDKKTYYFHLRPSFWSNGDPLTSHDFEYAWKKILSPDFNAPYTFLLFNIRNAQKFKKGLLPIDQVGIKSLSDHILQVDLIKNTPYFLELLTLPVFSPIHRDHDVNFPNWPFEEGTDYVCNGAFKLEKNHPQGGHILVKNLFYWENPSINLDHIIIAQKHPPQAYDLFTKNQIHWVGPPLSPWENYFKASEQDDLLSYPDNGLFWAVCQTQHPLLKNKKIRQALSIAIDRKELLQAIHYQSEPAFSPLPPVHSQISNDPYPFLPHKAQELWLEGLKELGFTPSTAPSFEISFIGYAFSGKQTADFLCHTWRHILNANCKLKALDLKTLMSHFATKEFDLGLLRWQPWVNDPFYTLNCFISEASAFKLGFCSDEHLIEKIQQAEVETDPATQRQLLREIELLLVEDVSIIPLFKTYYQSLKKKCVSIFPNHTLMDFKWAKLDLPHPSKA